LPEGSDVSPDPWARFASQFPSILEALLAGAYMTITVTFGGLLLSLALGVAGAALRLARLRALRAIGAAYVDVFRALPVLTQLFIIYFGLAEVGVRLDPVPAAVLGFGINGGAYLTEVFRAGVNAIDRGQTEAALAIGLRRHQAVLLVLLPQAARIALPPTGNFAIALLKETSVASSVAAPELMFRAHMLVDQTYLSAQIYLMVAVLYLAMSVPLSLLVRRLERRTVPTWPR
jgi:polar amino acid transport system permease protein/cystine transport system permease protein